MFKTADLTRDELLILVGYLEQYINTLEGRLALAGICHSEVWPTTRTACREYPSCAECWKEAQKTIRTAIDDQVTCGWDDNWDEGLFPWET